MMVPLDNVRAVVIYTTAEGGSALATLPLAICRKVMLEDGTANWEGIAGATGWGISSGAGEGYASWHVSAMPGLSIVLCGAWEIEASNGQRHILDTGDVLVMLDTSGRGHRSRTLTAPCAVMGVSFDEATHIQIANQVSDLVKAGSLQPRNARISPATIGASK